MEMKSWCPSRVYIYCGTTKHMTEIRQLSLGYLIFLFFSGFFLTFLQRETEGRFCCRGHPFCPLWRNMYTDIDIFKEDINLFFKWQRRKTKRTELWESFGKMLLKCLGRLSKLGMGAKGRKNNQRHLLISSRYLITDNMPTETDSATSGHTVCENREE